MKGKGSSKPLKPMAKKRKMNEMICGLLFKSRKFFLGNSDSCVRVSSYFFVRSFVFVLAMELRETATATTECIRFTKRVYGLGVLCV